MKKLAKELAKELRTVPERALFWIGVLLVTSRVLKLEKIPD